MSTECNHDCSSCGESCAERSAEQVDFSAKANELSHVGKVVAVVSGKGGVGKSLVTSLLTVLARRAGLKAAILDADITGPSIPKSFGLADRVVPPGRSLVAALELAEQIADFPPAAMLADRASVYRGLDLDLERAMAAEFQNGLSALVEGAAGARRFVGE
mgnify:CR=1 FL=1